MQFISIRLGAVEPGDLRGGAKALDELAESMRSVGLIHPVVLNTKHEVIAGRRRLHAARKLGWTHIGAVVAESFDDRRKAIRAERDENTCRVELKPSEKKRLADLIRQEEKPKAADRQTATRIGKNGKSSGKDGPPKFGGPAGEVEKIAAEVVGTSHETLRKIDAVVESGEADVIAEMDETGKVDPAFQEVKKRQAEKEADPLEAQAKAYTAEINLFVRRLDELQRAGKELEGHPLGRCVHWHSILDQLKAARGAAATGRPKFKCPYCKATGQKDDRKCRGCDGQGWVHKTTYKSGCQAVGAPDESEGEADE